VDTFRVFDHPNPTNTDEDMTFPAIIIWTQFRHGIIVGCECCNNSTTACIISSTESVLQHEDIGRDMAFLAGIIVVQLRKFSFPSTEHDCKSSLSVYIGKDVSGMLSLRVGNDFRASPVKNDPNILQIWLVAISSSTQHINRGANFHPFGGP
jgi:hypothetical protein